MRWRGGSSALAVLVLCGCGKEPPPRAEFSFEAAAEPVPVIVMRSAVATRPEGGQQREVQVILPTGIAEATARATLLHLIDSVRAADAAPAAVQVVGFVFGPVDPKTGLADVVPAISAVRMVDSATTRPRTEFFIHRTFPDSGTGRSR